MTVYLILTSAPESGGAGEMMGVHEGAMVRENCFDATLGAERLYSASTVN
jgi:hypothetical protein